MEKLIRQKDSSSKEKKSYISSDKRIAEWIAMYWSVSKRFTRNLGDS